MPKNTGAKSAAAPSAATGMDAGGTGGGMKKKKGQRQG